MGMMNMAISVVRQDKLIGLWSGVWPVSGSLLLNSRSLLNCDCKLCVDK